MSYTKAVDFET